MRRVLEDVDEPLSVRELVEETGLPRRTCYGAVDVLLEAGEVEETVAPDDPGVRRFEVE
ncbi:helix-turn-helix domain-containing protein [Salarchaeum sp. III]|uniref:helix-turn-helix domain-containing protein n=1 Tax=Salarchaeum sp. III TaxID=3107927 RepID=UPI002ED88D37